MFEPITCCQLIFAVNYILSQAERSLEHKTRWQILNLLLNRTVQNSFLRIISLLRFFSASP